MKKPPVNYIISIQDIYLANFIYWWIQHDKPCSLLFQKPKTESLTAIRITVDTDEASIFLAATLKKIDLKIYQK